MLEDLVNIYAKKRGPPGESDYDGAKNALFGWTDNGKGVWKQARPGAVVEENRVQDHSKHQQ